MKLNYRILFVLFSVWVFYSCKSDSPVTPENNDPADYYKVLTAESGSNKYELWKYSVNTLFNGYNQIGIKYFSNGTEVKDGYSTFFPMMYHGSGGPGHSSPVKEYFYYDESAKLFTGYANFLMISDSTSVWYADFNHNGTSGVDSVIFNVTSSPANQMLSWTDLNGGYTYALTLLKPLKASIGLNTFSVMLHRTTNDINYTEVNGAEMYIKPWMLAHGHSSSNNVNPVSLGNGIYEGKANFTMTGEWVVYDSIRYNGSAVTRTPSPYFYYIVR